MPNMKRLSLSARSRMLHIEAPGCIINIEAGLADAAGRNVTRVDVSAHGTRYADESPWFAHVGECGPAGVGCRVVQGDLEATSEPAAPVMRETVAQALATSVDALQRCNRDVAAIAHGDPGAPHESFLPLRLEWAERWPDRIAYLCREFLPSGSGLDSGVTLDTDRSTGERLVFLAPFHAMDAHGSYDGWRELTVTVRPSLIHGLTVSVRGGGGGGDLKDYVAEVIREALRAEHPRESLYPPAWSAKGER